MQGARKHISAKGMLNVIHRKFLRLNEQNEAANRDITQADCLMSGLAVFSLKFPSLLQYDSHRAETQVRNNLRTLFQVKNAPSDTYMRERLDEVDPKSLRPAYKIIFSLLQRGKALERYTYLNGHYLLSLDGTGHFSSKKIHCANCCEKHHRNGEITYYHQMLGAAIVHPDERVVIPLGPEPITKADGSEKNDCERNAAKRLIRDVRREHPHLKLIVIEDALAANVPHLQELQEANMRYIIGVKPGDHKSLFAWVNGTRCEEYEHVINGTKHRYRFINKIPLNDSHPDFNINFIEYWEEAKNGKVQHFSWITDITVTKENIYELMRGGRARWKIENETFNTIKNQGYQFEHNFGHGEKHLCTVFSFLMMLAFLVDQAQELCCSLFKRAREKRGSRRSLWEFIRSLMQIFYIQSWDALFEQIIFNRVHYFEQSADTS